MDQQNAEFVERRLMSTRQFLEARGDPSPEATQREIEYEDLLKSDDGLKFRISVLTAYTNDKFIEQIKDRISLGNANPDNGLAVGYAQALAGPPPDLAGTMGAPGAPAGGDMTGLGVPNPAAASLAGAVAGGLQTGPINTVAQAGGAFPAVPLPVGG